MYMKITADKDRKKPKRSWPVALMIAAMLVLFVPVLAPAVQTRAATARINTAQKSLYAGKTYQLKIRGSKETYKWTSDNRKVAKVDKKTGLVTAVRAGTAVITAASGDGSESFKCTVTVKKPYLTQERVTLWVGESTKIKLKGATATSFYCYEQDNDKIQVAEDGTITAVGEGRGIGVYARDDLNRLYVCSVEVKEPYVTPGSATLEIGESVKLKLTGTKAVEFFCNEVDDDKVTVSAKGLVTAKAPGETIGVYALDEYGNVYSSLITVSKPPEPTATPTPVPVVPTRVPEYYGLTIPHEKSEYVESESYYDINTDEAFLEVCGDSLSRGMKEFTVCFSSQDARYWIDLYQEHMGKYSDLASYGSVRLSYYDYKDGGGGWITFSPEYKSGLKAMFYLKYYDYEADKEALSVYAAAYQIASAAAGLYPGDLRAQLLYANNRICDMTTYSKNVSTDPSDSQFDATGVFFYGDAVCEGYTAAYRLILEMLGVENHVVVNTNGNHIWNRIRVDGTWYHTDVTWNDKFDPWTNTYANRYFLVTDEQLAALDPSDHAWIQTYLS